MLKDLVSKFAQDHVAPKVQEMDENELMDKGIIKALFENGLMAIETPIELGGAGASFTSAILVVEGVLFSSLLFLEIRLNSSLHVIAGRIGQG